jgi:excisionase family DNA binding protein
MDKSETLPLLVGIDESCELLSIQRTYLYDLINEGRLRPIKLGRRTLFRMRDLIAFADSGLAGEARQDDAAA